MAVIMQMACTSVVCYLCMSMGIMFTWPSSTLKLFQSTNTTLARPMGATELALFGSLSSIGALISTPLVGFYLDRLGRKYCAVLSSLTHVVAWGLIAACRQVEVVLLAIFISGVGGGVFLVAPVYVSEFCQESIRGAMTAGPMIFYMIGMLVSYLLGGYLDYWTMIYACLTISTLGVVLLAIVKESPFFLMQKGLEDEASKAIAFYRSVRVSSKEVQEELSAIRRAYNPDMDGCSEEEKNLKGAEDKEEAKIPEKLSFLQFLRKSPSTRRAMFVCLVLCTASIFQGLVVVQVYAEPLFEQAVPNISPTTCSVLFAIIAVVAGLLAGYLCDVAGRRSLMIYSSAATGVCCILLGTQIQFQWGPHFMTAVVIYVFCMIYQLGAGTMPFVISAEVFLPEIKSFSTMLVIEWVWFCNFVILSIFNPLVDAIGLGPVFYLFAAVSFGTAAFCLAYLPETKGLPVDAIQMLFTNKRKNRGTV